jgi:hypothetical protein
VLTDEANLAVLLHASLRAHITEFSAAATVIISGEHSIAGSRLLAYEFS